MAEEREDEEEQFVVEMLNELRVVLPGVQVLFAFLLTVPFTQRFEQLDSRDRAIYFAALMCAAGASAMLIAPSVYARLVRRREKSMLLSAATVLIVIGTLLLLAGIGCSVYLVGDVLYQSTTAAIATTVVVVAMLGTWYGIPLIDRSRHRRPDQ
jgi:hypothetical protein